MPHKSKRNSFIEPIRRRSVCVRNMMRSVFQGRASTVSHPVPHTPYLEHPGHALSDEYSFEDHDDEKIDLIDTSSISLLSSVDDILILRAPPHRGYTMIESFTASASTSPARPSRGASYKAHHELEAENRRKREDLSKLKQEIWKAESQQALQEVLNCVLDDKVEGLKEDLQEIKIDLGSLPACETEAQMDLDAAYESQKREIHDELRMKLTRVRTELAEEIETAMTQVREHNIAHKQDLDLAVVGLRSVLDGISLEMDNTIATLKKDHEQSVESIRAEADEKLAQIRHEASMLTQRISERQVHNAILHASLKNEAALLVAHYKRTLDALQKKQVEREQTKEVLQQQLIDVRIRIEELQAAASKSIDATHYYADATKEIVASYAALEDERRLLHNQLQEVKGNIRVYCRVCPVIGAGQEQVRMEIASSAGICEIGKQVLSLESNTVLSDIGTLPMRAASERTDAHNRRLQHRFHFDQIFPQDSNNREIFLEISQLVQSCLDGFNVCVFAYGQTGSGKTWTMSHNEDGMIPLSIKKIFSDITDLQAQGWEYSVEGRFVEIYNDQIVDLLSTSKNDTKYEIKHDDFAKKTYITNCTTLKLTSQAHALDVLEKVTIRRATASTLANSRSSRSHSVFIIDIKGTNQVTSVTSEGTLNLIDLAGSERLNSSQVKGIRLRETQAINKSLSCLGDVIHSLGQRQSQGSDANGYHIPFRNSRLTYLLKHSLGGDSKTLMFVNISLSMQNCAETINSLRFATKVNATRLR